MFTIEQIKAAHSRVKSGADFPGYIHEIAKLGVASYETYVSDNHSVFFAEKGMPVKLAALPGKLIVSDKTDAIEFSRRLKEHQQGKTDYPTFRNDCANNGVDKWLVLISNKTCTYYDKAGKEVFSEAIPV